MLSLLLFIFEAKMKTELKWTIALLLLLFPLLALVIMNSPVNKEEKLSKDFELIKGKDTLAVTPVLQILSENTDFDSEYTSRAESYPQNYFSLPVDFDVFLSGTFGELRSNHFHSGIDIRTGGVEGKHILATADGYISRINLSTKGYGNALYITHPNGYTSVYAHLQKFNKDIQFYVKKNQYAKKSYELELYPPNDLLTVSKGEIIAFSGNTGGSAGPHLHFEIRKTASQQPINPLLFGLNITDNLAPEILQLYIYQVDQNYRKNYGTYPFSSISCNKNQHPKRLLTQKVPPGTYAFGAYMKDYFRSVSENLGINYSELLLNNESIFSCAIEKISFDKTRYINAHMDFCVHKTASKKTQKFFKDDGNRLDYYSVNKSNGHVTLKANDTINLRFIAKDLTGKRDSLSLTIICDSSSIFAPNNISVKKAEEAVCQTFSTGKSLAFGSSNAKIILPANALYFNYSVCIQPLNKTPRQSLSDLIQFGENHVAVHNACDIAIKPNNIPSQINNQKLLIVELDKGAYYNVGGKYVNGYVETSVKNFGSYFVSFDTTAPVIRVLKFNQANEFSFTISDNLSGIKNYNAFINDKWILMEYEPKTGVLKGKWESDNEEKTEPENKHTFKLIVVDERNNTATFNKSF